MVGEGKEGLVVRHQKSPSQQHRKEDQERREQEAHKVQGSLSRGLRGAVCQEPES